jgi:glucose/arabinose dehydrogenase
VRTVDVSGGQRELSMLPPHCFLKLWSKAARGDVMTQRTALYVPVLAAFLSSAMLTLAHAETVETQKVRLSVDTLATGLDHPWAVEVLPDNAIVITERSGQLRIFRNRKVSEPVAGMPKVYVRNQGGLLDVALSPDFTSDRTLFFTASRKFERRAGIAVFSGKLSKDEKAITDIKTIYRSQHPGKRAVNLGSRIAFAPDKTMFIGIGDQFMPDRAQDFHDDHGAIIHINRDGSPAADNPFRDSAKGLAVIWSKGHRNPQGIAFDAKTGVLYTAEHGAKGGDEINHPEPGKNYGWPVISYGVNYNGSKIGIGTSAKGYEQPLHYWDPSIAPGAMLVYRGTMFPEWDGDLLVTALKFELISRLSRDGTGKITGEEQILTDAYGRLRDIKEMPDGSLLVTTDSDDGALLRISRAEGS